MGYDYTKYNFQELVSNIQQQLSAASDNPAVWKDSNHSSTAQVIVQIISSVTDNLMYYLERRTQETYITTARLKSAVNSIANAMGYRPRLSLSSGGTLRLVLDQPAIQQILIPKYSSLTFDKKNFVMTSNLTINIGEDVVDFDIIQGVVETVEVDTQTGLILSNDSETDVFYDINSKYLLISGYDEIENDSVDVFTDAGQSFYDVRKSNPITNEPPLTALTFAYETDQVYDIRIANDGLRIQFGDGFFGELPTGKLTIRWIRSNGPLTNISTYWDINTSSGTVNSFVFDAYSSLLDGDTPIPNEYFYDLYNITAIDGGLVSETIDEVKLHAPDYVRTNHRAVTKHDYEYWVSQSGVGGIIDVSAFGESEIGYNIINANNVYIYYLQSDATELTLSEKQELKTFMDVYKTVTSVLIINQAINVPLVFDITITPTDTLSMPSTQVIDNTILALEEFFSLGNTSIGKSCYHSNVVDMLQNYQVIDQTGLLKDMTKNVTVKIKAIKVLDLHNHADQSVLFVSNLSNSLLTGIPSDPTVYSFDVFFDGVTNINVSEIGSNLLTFGDVINTINTQISGYGIAYIDDNKIVIQSDNFETSSVDITDTNLFSALNGTIQTAVVGSNAVITNSIPLSVLQLPTLPENFILPTSMELVDVYGNSIPSNGFKRVLMGVGINGSDVTTITDSAMYGVDITVDGGAPQSISISGLNLTTYQDVVDQINAVLVGASIFIVNGQFIVYSHSTGLTSTIAIDESLYANKLFESLYGFTVFETAVGGNTKTIDVVIDTNTGYFGCGNVDYSTGVITFIQTVNNGRYYIKYSQNENQNFDANNTQVILLDKQQLDNDVNAKQILTTVTVV